MRKAIIKKLKEITDFSNEVHQALLAPTNTPTPYCTVKIAGESKVLNNKSGSFKELQIFVYTSPSTFTPLDELEIKIRKKLHNVTLTIDDSPKRYFTIYYNNTIQDIFDEERKLISKRIDFLIPLARA